jgi:class 3 adenylate cyclase
VGIAGVRERPHVRAHTRGARRARLATVLFSDIVDSTPTLARLGDYTWTSVLNEHNVRIRAAIDRWGGREIGTTGDGFFAIFDGAAKAVRAAALMAPEWQNWGSASGSASTR